jgi:hypothetical protein
MISSGFYHSITLHFNNRLARAPRLSRKSKWAAAIAASATGPARVVKIKRWIRG